MGLVAAVVNPGMDVDSKSKMQVDDDAEMELNCEYSSRIGSVGELTAEWSSTYWFIVVVALARKRQIFDLTWAKLCWWRRTGKRISWHQVLWSGLVDSETSQSLAFQLQTP